MVIKEIPDLWGFSMSEKGFFSASNDIKTLDGNIFSG